MALPEEGCAYFGNPDEAALGCDCIYIGFWTDRGSCDKDTADFLKKITDQKVFLFGTAGFGGEQAYYDRILRSAAKLLPASCSIIGSFLCQGRMPMSVRQRYEKMLKSPIKPPNLQSMIENFDKALSHPDEADLAAAEAAALQAFHADAL